MMRALALAAALACAACGPAPPMSNEPISLALFSDSIQHYRNRHGADYETYRPNQTREIADNLLLLQRYNGGWIENRDPTRILTEEDRIALENEKRDPTYSFDNRNIYSQVEYLFIAHQRTRDQRYRVGAMRGLERILNAQMNSCGGWAHTTPARLEYHSHLTIADDVTSGNLDMLRRLPNEVDLADNVADRIERALERGDQCLLDLQIVQNGVRTGWAGQYNPDTLTPAGARSFELPAIVSQETVQVVRYLMTIPAPSQAQIDAIESAIAWLERSKIVGVRIEEVPLDKPVRYEFHTAAFDRRLVGDATAPPLWARFYDLHDNTVILANRDGVRVRTYAQIHPERRTGYAWYGDWPADLLATEYPAWKARLETQSGPP